MKISKSICCFGIAILGLTRFALISLSRHVDVEIVEFFSFDLVLMFMGLTVVPAQTEKLVCIHRQHTKNNGKIQQITPTLPKCL